MLSSVNDGGFHRPTDRRSLAEVFCRLFDMSSCSRRRRRRCRHGWDAIACQVTSLGTRLVGDGCNSSRQTHRRAAGCSAAIATVKPTVGSLVHYSGQGSAHRNRSKEEHFAEHGGSRSNLLDLTRPLSTRPHPYCFGCSQVGLEYECKLGGIDTDTQRPHAVRTH